MAILRGECMAWVPMAERQESILDWGLCLGKGRQVEKNRTYSTK